jgi:Glycosyl hydrolase family 85
MKSCLKNIWYDGQEVSRIFLASPQTCLRSCGIRRRDQTIPPTVWTNAAHKNGVSCLATLNLDSLVLEHEEKDKDFPVLEYLRDMPAISQKMYDIAFYFKFDGYLFNYKYYDRESEN